jgi:DegV family protein with EDD domain
MPEQRVVGVVTDSTADIPNELVHSHAIEMVPALLIIDGETYEDGREISREEFYQRLPGFTNPPTTATPSSASFQAAYQRIFDTGIKEIVSIHVASSLSGMFTSASQAAQEFEGKVHVVDSGQLSLGLGFQVIETALAAMSGASVKEVLRIARQSQARVRVAALINTLEYLRRSGRVSWLQAGVGDFLKIKQLVSVNEGSIQDLGKKRTFDRALENLLEVYKSWGECERLAVLHTGVPELANRIASDLHDQVRVDPLIVEVTTIIGAHVGPGSLGLAALTT